ncbi:hypothetical protein [Nocardia brasiliensis]|uniref:hypothetical protein n=1 Tax=Nocardia brasiliensis TaxID=37326 RepID=UPI0015801610|nr:hypothetical protein [Nocardia brasiliensis]
MFSPARPAPLFQYQLYTDDEAASAHRFTEHFLAVHDAAARFAQPSAHVDLDIDDLFGTR